MTVLPELEDQLVRAAAKNAAAAHGRARTARLPRRAGPLAGAVGVAALIAVTVVIAAGALILVGDHDHHPRASHPHPTPAVTIETSRAQLIRILGVLRRPQTYADLHSPAIERFLAGYHSGSTSLLYSVGTPEVPLIRRAASTPWGSGVFVIPMKPLSAARLAALRARYPQLPQLAELPHGETIDLEVGFGGGCCATAAGIEAGHEVTTQGAGRSFAGGSTQTRLTLVVPDGVARVEFVFPRQPSRYEPGSPIYPAPLRVTVPVHGNVAAVQVKRESGGGAVAMIWYGPHGRVVKRIGSLAAAYRVFPPPKPGPATAQSRAAERNPSTPNRVWVTPASGNTRSKYSVHFRLLLTDADYRFQISGTRCPQITFAGGGGGGYSDLRGKTFSYALDAVTGQTWCPGTYDVSVTVLDLGRYGYLQHPAAPFGRATFTVR